MRTDSPTLVRVRRGTETDAEGMCRVHFEAVRQTASAFYPPEVIESWTHTPDDGRQEQFRRAVVGGEELFIVAEANREVVGFGSIAPRRQELAPSTSIHASVGAELEGGSFGGVPKWPV